MPDLNKPIPEQTFTPQPAKAARFRVCTKAAVKRLAVLFITIGLLSFVCYRWCIWMPGETHAGPLPVTTDSQKALAEALQRDVTALASEIGKRSTFDPRGMAESAKYLIAEMTTSGYAPPREVFVQRNARTPNLEFTLPGTTNASEIIVIGAHYDTFQGTPGADDNASGCAATLALARLLKGRPQARTIRFVFFVNEEPPSFWTEDMGSWVYAKDCRSRNDNIVAMLSLETMGYYTDIVGYQKYPPLVGSFYPEEGNYIAFISNLSSRSLLHTCIGTFRETTPFPSEGAALPSYFPGVGWSDHWSFWKEGYPAIMVTDTANFRNPHYHIASDKPSTLDYDSFARVVEGLERVVIKLAGP